MNKGISYLDKIVRTIKFDGSDVIFKIAEETETTYIGYDMLTGKYIEIRKEKTVLIKNDNIFMSLFGNIELTTLFAILATNTYEQAGKLLNISDRTFLRYVKDYINN